MGDGFPVLYEAWWVQMRGAWWGSTKEFCQLCAPAGSSASVHQTNFSTSWPPPRARPGTAWLSSNCMRHRSQLCGKRWKSRLKLGNPAAGSPERHSGLHATSTRTRTAPWGSRRSTAPAKWLAHRHAHTHTHLCTPASLHSHTPELTTTHSLTQTHRGSHARTLHVPGTQSGVHIHKDAFTHLHTHLNTHITCTLHLPSHIAHNLHTHIHTPAAMNPWHTHCLSHSLCTRMHTHGSQACSSQRRFVAAT